MSNEKTAQPLKNDYPAPAGISMRRCLVVYSDMCTLLPSAGLSAPPPTYGTPGVHGYQPQPAVMGQVSETIILTK